MITRRRLRGPAAAVAALLVTSGCGSPLAGVGRMAADAGTRSSAAPAPARPSRPGGQGAASLEALLLPAPAGSTPWSTPWARDRTPTPERWVSVVYPARGRALILQHVRHERLLAIAHRTWYAVDGDQADLQLFRFATAAGALERYRLSTQAKAAVATTRSFAIPGTSGAIGFGDIAVDPKGNVPAIVYAIKGRIMMELFYYSPDRLRTADAIAWTKGQLARLP